MTKTRPEIFAIIGLKADKMDRNIGTGFFINESGGFVTAAHTFKKAIEGWTYFAIINKSPVSLKPFYIEYSDLELQVAPTHQDLCLGCLTLEQPTEYLEFSLSKELAANDKLEFKGYASTKHADEEPEELVVPVESNITMADLWAELESEDYGDLDDTNEEFHDPFAANATADDDEPKVIIEQLFADAAPAGPKEVSLILEIDKLQYSEITGSYTHANFEKIFDWIPIEGVFTNGFTFTLTNANIKPQGLSGCPVLRKGKTAGMLITKNAAITAEYIMDQLGKQAIKYYTASSPS
jgi:hypothetical protein